MARREPVRDWLTASRHVQTVPHYGKQRGSLTGSFSSKPSPPTSTAERSGMRSSSSSLPRCGKTAGPRPSWRPAAMRRSAGAHPLRLPDRSRLPQKEGRALSPDERLGHFSGPQLSCICRRRRRVPLIRSPDAGLRRCGRRRAKRRDRARWRRFERAPRALRRRIATWPEENRWPPPRQARPPLNRRVLRKVAGLTCR